MEQRARECARNDGRGGIYIEEGFLDCVCRHPSQQTRRMEERNRQTPLGMTEQEKRQSRLAFPAKTKRRQDDGRGSGKPALQELRGRWWTSSQVCVPLRHHTQGKRARCIVPLRGPTCFNEANCARDAKYFSRA